MSDSYLILIAEDLRFEPERQQLEFAREFLEEIAEAEEVEVIRSGELKFYDCGENFEQVFCPACGRELFLDWWQERLNEAFRHPEIQLARWILPCCEADATLHELRCVWPQGFGTFAVQAMNPVLNELDEDQLAELEQIIGTKLRVIQQHI